MPDLENMIIWPFTNKLKAVQHILIWFSTRQIHSLRNKEDRSLTPSRHIFWRKIQNQSANFPQER